MTSSNNRPRTPPPCMSFGLDNTNPFDSDDDLQLNLRETSLYTHDVPIDGDPRHQPITSEQDSNNHTRVPMLLRTRYSWFRSLFQCSSTRIIYSFFGLITFSLLISALVIIFHFNHIPGYKKTRSASSKSLSIGKDISFYLLSNMPHSEIDEQLILESFNQLGSLPNETGEKGSFLIHLGDIGSPRHRCASFVYNVAETVFESCPIPFFIIPGNNDWNDCPDPEVSWGKWEKSFGNHKLEDEHGSLSNVFHQDDREENFCFLEDGVLFIGIHLVDGSVKPTQQTWDYRIHQDVKWVKENLNKYEGDYRAVVVFGHSPPIHDLDDYFMEIVKAWKVMQESSPKEVPFLYAFANKYSSKLVVYRPHQWNIPHMYALENVRGGLAKVRIVFGEDPFIFEDLRFDEGKEY